MEGRPPSPRLLTLKPTDPSTHIDAGSPGWRIVWEGAFAIAKRSSRLMSMLVTLRVPTYGKQVVTLSLVGRKTGRQRPVLVSMIELDGRRYVGHPNGPTAWVANLAAMETVTLAIAHEPPLVVHPTPLAPGPERTAVIKAAAHRGPIQIRPLHWASRGHVLRAAIYFRLDPL